MIRPSTGPKITLYSLVVQSPRKNFAEQFPMLLPNHEAFRNLSGLGYCCTKATLMIIRHIPVPACGADLPRVRLWDKLTLGEMTTEWAS